MFRIKICGVTNVDDARLAAEAGADAIGLNFYRPSPRSVSIDVACEIADSLPEGIVRVGVFVNATADEIDAVCERVVLDCLQLHGDEPPEFVAGITRLPVIRAFCLGDDGAAPVTAYLAKCWELGALPSMVLVDAHRPGHFGGTGSTADWSTAREMRDTPGVPPLVLAGGLTEDNVAEAVATVRPHAVDTASGVESEPGRKDPLLVRGFVEQARVELNRLE